MPKSKRDRKVTLSKVKKRTGLETKQALVERVRGSVDEHERLFVFAADNMRNNHLKEVRETWKHSTFFMGKNRVMSLALGRSEAEEYADNLFRVSKLLRDQRGLLFTSRPEREVLSFFEGHEAPDFHRTGATATETVTLPGGALPQFPHSLEPQLRQLGLATALKKGVVHLLGEEHTVCREGDVLTSEQARLLKLLGHQDAKFR